MFHRKYLLGLVSSDEKIREFQKHFVNFHKLIYYGFMIEPYGPGRNTTRHIGLWKYKCPNMVMVTRTCGLHTAETAHTWAGEHLASHPDF